MGCHASEANLVEQGGFLQLRSSAPTFSRVGYLRDPDADDPHGSFGGRGGWWGRFSQQMRISNLGLSVCLFYDVVVPKPPSEREVAAEGRRKEPYGTNASGEGNNCILRKMLKQHPSKPFLHALSSTRFAGAPSRREPWIRGCLTRRQIPI